MKAKAALTFRLRMFGARAASERNPRGRPEHWRLFGPDNKVLAWGPSDTYEPVERLLKLAGAATRLLSREQLAAAGVFTTAARADAIIPNGLPEEVAARVRERVNNR